MSIGSNTEILIKRSLSTDVPSSLQQGELGYSYSSNTLFIGTPDGLGSIEIGHRSDLSQLNAGTYGDATHIPIIVVDGHGTVTNVTTSAISTTLSLSSDNGSNTMSLLDGTLTITGGDGITSHIDANTSDVVLDVDNTVVRSNTAIADQYIDGNIQISGNLVVLGTQQIIDTQVMNVADPLIYLAANNYTSDVVDIGFVGNYYDASTDTQRHAGVMRHAGDDKFYIFHNYDKEPTSNVVDVGDASFVLAELNANLQAPYANVTSNLYVSGQATFDDTTVRFRTGTNIEIDSGTLNLNNGNRVKFGNSDQTDQLQIHNQGNSGNTQLRFYDNNLETDLFELETNTGNNSANFRFNQNIDLIDNATGESLLSKGEQKFGVVTRIDMDGTGGATFKVIEDTYNTPPVSNMTPVDLGNDYDDAFTEVALPWSWDFNGVSYSSVFACSNGYLTFGGGSTNNSHNVSATETNGNPAIVIAKGDISYQKVYTYTDSNTFRVRWEGTDHYNSTHIGGSSSIVWEVVFYQGLPRFDVRIVKINGSRNAVGTPWVSYLTDGTNFIGNWQDQNRVFPVTSQVGHLLVSDVHSVELQQDGKLRLPNGTTLSDDTSGFFVDSLNAAETSSVVFYDTTTKELTYGTMADLRPDRIQSGSNYWDVDSVTGALTNNHGLAVGDNSYNGTILGYNNLDSGNGSNKRTSIGWYDAGTPQIGQSWSTVSIGPRAGNINQNAYAVAIGNRAGYQNQSTSAVAIGGDGSSGGAGQINQGYSAIALGAYAGYDVQSEYAVAIGRQAGQLAQGLGAIAVGLSAGHNSQNPYAVALGYQAGYGSVTAQGQYSVAIGTNAGYSTMAEGSIAINASANELNTTTEGLFINPVRYTATQDATYDGLMFYNASTKEVRYSYTLDGGSF